MVFVLSWADRFTDSDMVLFVHICLELMCLLFNYVCFRIFNHLSCVVVLFLLFGPSFGCGQIVPIVWCGGELTTLLLGESGGIWFTFVSANMASTASLKVLLTSSTLFFVVGGASYYCSWVSFLFFPVRFDFSSRTSSFAFSCAFSGWLVGPFFFRGICSCNHTIDFHIGKFSRLFGYLAS